MVSFYEFPEERRHHLPMTDPVESPFSALRLRRNAMSRFKRTDTAVAVISKIRRVTERRFGRRQERDPIEGSRGVKYVDGVELAHGSDRAVGLSSLT